MTKNKLPAPLTGKQQRPCLTHKVAGRGVVSVMRHAEQSIDNGNLGMVVIVPTSERENVIEFIGTIILVVAIALAAYELGRNSMRTDVAYWRKKYFGQLRHNNERAAR